MKKKKGRAGYSVEVTVTRYRCPVCSSTYDEEADADACCVCACGRLIGEAERKRHAGKCRRCVLKEAIRYAQQRRRQLALEIESNAEHIDTLQKEKEAIDDAEEARARP